MNWRPYRQAVLAPAEFYYLCDFRGELFLSANHQGPDADPQTSETIRKARLDSLRAFEPQLTDSFRPDIKSWRQIKLSPELVHRWTSIKTPMPENPSHFDTIYDYSSSTYEIVSPAWKAAVEDFEPNIHEFYPHEFRFSDGKIWPCYIVRSGQQLDYPASKDDLAQMADSLWRDPVDGGYNRTPRPVHARRDILNGKHWVEYDFHAASRPLAEKLLPLLPPCMELVPLVLV